MDINFLSTQVNKTVLDYARSIVRSCQIKNLVGEFKVFDQNNIGWTDAIDEEQWRFLNNKAAVELSKIIRPKHKTLLARVVGVVRPICVEIQKWIGDHRYLNITGIDIEEIFCWTYEGLIDRKKTAKELITNENLCIQSRFELACNYCFMYYVESLWSFLSESEKRRYSGEHIQISNRIIDFWIKWLTTGARKNFLLSPDRDFDQLCFNAYYTNSEALKYFLHVLTTEDREKYLTKIAKEKCLIPRVMHFCLLEMDSNQKAEMFYKTPFKTLKCFLDFPWQHYFLVIALHMRDYLREVDFVHLIYFIIYEKISPGWRDYNYVELLTEFWIQSPSHFKEYVKDQEIFKVLDFIVGRMMDQGFLKMTDLNKFLKDFILHEETKNIYQKACRSC